jgi:diacylglycerol O-acyltransferase
LIAASSSVAQRVLTAQTELLNVLQQVLANTVHKTEESNAPQHPGANAERVTSVNDFARFMPELAGTTQRLPFNIICQGPQRFRWAEIPLADIKAVKQACGATVNDIVLTLVTSAVQRYSELRKVRIRGRLLRIVVPVNVRGNGSKSELGNRITFLPVTIPLDIRNPRKLVAAIRERMAFLKSAHVPEFVGMVGTMLGTIPTAAQALVGPIVSQLPLGLCNIICTNVPGPAFPLYLRGHKMVRCYPYVPIGGDIGINCAVLTYDGTAYFGFTGDVHAAPDLGRLEKFLMTGFRELRQAVGLGTPRRHPRPSKTKEAAVLNPSTTPPQPVVAPVVRMEAKSARVPTAREDEPTEHLARVAV